MKPIAYTLDHVDLGWLEESRAKLDAFCESGLLGEEDYLALNEELYGHDPFPLVLAARVRPAPILPITNVARVRHARHVEGAIYYTPPLYRRVLRRGDFT